MILDYHLAMWDKMPVESLFAIMRHTECNMLHCAAKQLADNSVIVEVGSALGGGACIMAAANPNITVNCVEQFQTNNIEIWNQLKKDIHRLYQIYHLARDQVPARTSLDIVSLIDNCFLTDPTGKLAFELITKNFSNIKLHHGESPINFLNWTQPIDIYLEDATHHNPALHENIKFWSNHVKPGGFIIGHDYQNLDTISMPDVVSEFNKLIFNGWDLISKVDSLIILQKPRGTIKE